MPILSLLDGGTLFDNWLCGRTLAQATLAIAVGKCLVCLLGVTWLILRDVETSAATDADATTGSRVLVGAADMVFEFIGTRFGVLAIRARDLTSLLTVVGTALETGGSLGGIVIGGGFRRRFALAKHSRFGGFSHGIEDIDFTTSEFVGGDLLPRVGSDDHLELWGATLLLFLRTGAGGTVLTCGCLVGGLQVGILVDCTFSHRWEGQLRGDIRDIQFGAVVDRVGVLHDVVEG
ncbi:Uncharacterised protein [uncultured archaeon]|nr:Uncharacterised protein [uncultured archaeon]